MAAARRPADLRRSARAGHLRRPIVRTVQVSIDALVIPEVLPFWRACSVTIIGPTAPRRT